MPHAQVPLLWTAYAQVSFRDFMNLRPDSAAQHEGFFEIPPSYQARTLDDAAAKQSKKSAERAASLPSTSSADPASQAALKELEDDIKFEW